MAFLKPYDPRGYYPQSPKALMWWSDVVDVRIGKKATRPNLRMKFWRWYNG